MVTQLTCPFQDHAPLLRGKLCLFHLPQPPVPSLTPNPGVVGGILGELLLWLKLALYKKYVKLR